MTFAENNRISHRQLYRQLILSFTAPFLLCLFGEKGLHGRQGIFGCLCAVFLLLFYVIFLIRLAPSFARLSKTCGNLLSGLIGIFFLLYTEFTAAYLAAVLAEVVPESLLEGVPRVWITFGALLVCVHGSHRGMQRRGRMAEVTGALLLGVVLFMMVLCLGQADPAALRETMAEGSGGLYSLWKNGYGVLCAFSGIGLLPFLLEHVEKPGSAWKPAALGILTVGGILISMLLLLPAVLGTERLKAEAMPVLPLLSGANLPGSVLARFDVLWMGFVVYGLLFAIAGMFHYSHQILQSSFQGSEGLGKRLSERRICWSERRQKLGQWQSFLLGAAVFFLSEVTIGGYGIRDYYPLYLGVFFLPGMLLIQVGILLKEKGRRKKRIAVSILGVLLLFLCGCAGVEPEKRMYPLAIGIGETGEGIRVWYGMPDLQKSTGQQKEEEGQTPSVLEITGKNFDEIEAQYEKSQEKFLDLGHVEVLLLEKGLLNGSRWEEVLQYLKQERMLGENIYVFSAEDPGEILSWQKESGTSVGKYLTGILENGKKKGVWRGTTLREVYRQWYGKGKPGALPEVRLEEGMPILEGLGASRACGSSGETGLMAWWGTLYPDFCFGLVKEEGISRVRPKISFCLAKFLKW